MALFGRPAMLSRRCRTLCPGTFNRSYGSHVGSALTVFTEEQTALRDMVAKFAADVVQPRVAAMDEREQLDPVVLRGLFDNGLMGIEIPEEFGGPGMTFTDAIIVVEELAKVDPAVSVVCDVQNTLVNTVLMKYGTAEQQKRHLPALVVESVGSFCLSESTSGSDAFALRTTATRKGSDYVLNGSKMWITNSQEAALFLVFANVDPQKLGYRGITCFLVERTDPGLTVHPKERKLGIRASSTCTVSFDNVLLPRERLIGTEGQGYKIAIESLNEGRVGIAAQMLGLAKQALYTHALPYVQQRVQFGQPVSNFQAVQHQVAQLATDIECAHLLTYNACRLREALSALELERDNHQPGMRQQFVSAAAMAKLVASQVAQRTASAAIDLMGGVGFTRDLPVEKLYRDCKIGSIYEGTSNVQLNTIAKLLLAKGG